jgi:hypothetical protein
MDRESLFWAAIEALAGEKYAIVKQSGPIRCPPVGGDLDLFCDSAVECSRRLLSLSRDALGSGFEIEVTCLHDSRQIHVDFFAGERLEFRFDCYGRLPPFKRVRMKDCYFDKVLSDRVLVEHGLPGRSVNVALQCAEDESILRYLEYHEYFPSRPDKVKHLDWVIEASGDEASRVRFLKRLHWFTELPVWNAEVSSSQPVVRKATSATSVPLRAVRKVRALLAPLWRAIRSPSR